MITFTSCDDVPDRSSSDQGSMYIPTTKGMLQMMHVHLYTLIVSLKSIRDVKVTPSVPSVHHVVYATERGIYRSVLENMYNPEQYNRYAAAVYLSLSTEYRSKTVPDVSSNMVERSTTYAVYADTTGLAVTNGSFRSSYVTFILQTPLKKNTNSCHGSKKYFAF